MSRVSGATLTSFYFANWVQFKAVLCLAWQHILPTVSAKVMYDTKLGRESEVVTATSMGKGKTNSNSKLFHSDEAATVAGVPEPSTVPEVSESSPVFGAA